MRDEGFRPPPRRPPITAAEIATVVGGDEAAVRRFVGRVGPLLLQRLQYFGQGRFSKQDCEDLAQEIFVEMFRADCAWLRAWDPALGRSFEGYLSTLAQRRTLDRLRRRTPERSMDDQELASRAGPAAASGDAVPRWVGQVLDRYKADVDEEGVRFLDAMLAERPAKEVALEFRMTPDAVHKRRERIRKRLRELRKEMGEEDND